MAGKREKSRIFSKIKNRINIWQLNDFKWCNLMHHFQIEKCKDKKFIVLFVFLPFPFDQRRQYHVHLVQAKLERFQQQWQTYLIWFRFNWNFATKEIVFSRNNAKIEMTGLVKAKEYNVADSNIENLGTQLVKKLSLLITFSFFLKFLLKINFWSFVYHLWINWSLKIEKMCFFKKILLSIFFFLFFFFEGISHSLQVEMHSKDEFDLINSNLFDIFGFNWKFSFFRHRCFKNISAFLPSFFKKDSLIKKLISTFICDNYFNLKLIRNFVDFFNGLYFLFLFSFFLKKKILYFWVMSLWL